MHCGAMKIGFGKSAPSGAKTKAETPAQLESVFYKNTTGMKGKPERGLTDLVSEERATHFKWDMSGRWLIKIEPFVEVGCAFKNIAEAWQYVELEI